MKSDTPIKYASVYWSIADIQDLRPEWDDKRCEEFLLKIEDHLQSMMIAKGWEIVEAELDWDSE